MEERRVDVVVACLWRAGVTTPHMAAAARVCNTASYLSAFRLITAVLFCALDLRVARTVHLWHARLLRGALLLLLGLLRLLCLLRLLRLLPLLPLLSLLRLLLLIGVQSLEVHGIFVILTARLQLLLLLLLLWVMLVAWRGRGPRAAEILHVACSSGCCRLHRAAWRWRCLPRPGSSWRLQGW